MDFRQYDNLYFGFKPEKEIETQITPQILENFETGIIVLLQQILNSEEAFEEK